MSKAVPKKPATMRVAVRKDIGRVLAVKLRAGRGTQWFYTGFKVRTHHPSHRKPKWHAMHPTHMWVASKPFKSKEFYGGNSHFSEISLSEKRKPAKWDGRTCGGTAPAKSKCKFPFTYQGKTYTSCTTAGRSKYEAWCMTSSPGQWGYCDCRRYTTWQGTAGPEEKCVFPFYVGGKWYQDCMPAKIISNKLTYACDSGRCRGNMPNGVCSVDKLYRGRWGACQPRGWRPTSLATSQRLTNGQGPAKAGTKCVLPFYYHGRWHYNCVGDAYGGYGWCSTTSKFTKSKNWGGCRKPLPRAQRYIRWPDDVTKRVGHMSAPEDKCAFPFKFKGGTYYNCADAGPNIPFGWCSLDHQWKGRWGACAHEGYRPAKREPGERWTDGKQGTARPYTKCAFPFEYHGKRFNSCVNRSKKHPNGWCSTTPDFANKWGSCLPKDKMPPKQDCKLTPWSPWTRGDVTIAVQRWMPRLYPQSSSNLAACKVWWKALYNTALGAQTEEALQGLIPLSQEDRGYSEQRAKWRADQGGQSGGPVRAREQEQETLDAYWTGRRLHSVRRHFRFCVRSHVFQEEVRDNHRERARPRQQ